VLHQLTRAGYGLVVPLAEWQTARRPRGEVLGLCWRDVDFEARSFGSASNCSGPDHVRYLGPVKTSAGRRHLPQLGIAWDALVYQGACANSAVMSPHWSKHDVVFTTAPVSQSNRAILARSFERICEAARPAPHS
jgi:hypothetical protein